jgi:hypothetical protein
MPGKLNGREKFFLAGSQCRVGQTGEKLFFFGEVAVPSKSNSKALYTHPSMCLLIVKLLPNSKYMLLALCGISP